MDEAETMDPAVVEQLFEQGLMGVGDPRRVWWGWDELHVSHCGY